MGSCIIMEHLPRMAQHKAIWGASVSMTPLAQFLMRMQAVRAVFNIEIGADSADLQRTARSALLQMLNTVVKRITMATVVSAASNARYSFHGT